MRLLKPIFAQWLYLLLLATNSSWSLPDDGDQPIYIESDHAEQTSANGREITTYTGNVIMVQGSMLLKGDKVVVHSRQRSVSSIIADGNPAQFQQQPAHDKALLNAHANHIEYDLSNDTILLLHNAYVEQAGSTLSGDRIDYNLITEQVKASSTDDSQSRVHMVLEPDDGTSVIH